MAAIFISACT